MSEASPAVIERREFKFLVHRSVADRVREEVKPFCELDPFSARAPGHRYRIRSLYLDTPDLALYRANEQELLDRFKLRVRGYPDVPGSAVYFEVKARHHDAIRKTRGKVVGPWVQMLEDPFVQDARLASAPVQRFVTLAHTHHARPITVVQYRREAWTSQLDSYARVTLDTHIHCQKQPHFTLEAAHGGWRAQDDALTQHAKGSSVVLELKFVSTAPSWMSEIVKRNDLWRRAFSKYCTSVRVWHFPPERRQEAV